jgi:predicted naringenin-chalcone synthase
MPLVIRSLATAAPQYDISQSDAAAVMQTFAVADEKFGRGLAALFRKARVQRRGSVLLEQPEGVDPRHSFYPAAVEVADRGPGTGLRMERFAEEAPQLAERAARQALEASGVPAAEITHIVIVSCTGFVSPGVDIMLMDRLGLPPTTQRVQVGFMGCHGLVNGLRVAEGLASLDRKANVLVCAVELCTLHLAYGAEDPQRLVANSLFADGSTALVVSSNPEASGRAMRGTASCVFPDSQHAMTWKVGDNGFTMTLEPAVPGLIASCLRPWLEEWLATHDLTLADIKNWAVHPGGPRILTCVAETLDLPTEALATSASVLADHGNMSSPTIAFIMERLIRAGQTGPCVALGFGPGLVAEAMLVDL